MKAIPTKVDGILFRSKLEAHWYECFKRCGLGPVYEPESFALTNQYGKTINYAPDFRLDWNNCYVEVKPLKDEYVGHDAKSIRAICMMGYESPPSMLLLGSPFRFGGCFIHSGIEGNPMGYSMNSLITRDWTYWVALDFYPYQNPIDEPISLKNLNIPSINGNVANAANAWNAIQYRHRNS